MRIRETTDGASAAGAIISLLVLLGSLVLAWGFGGAVLHDSGSVVSTGTVERIAGRSTVVARVDEPGGSRARDVQIDLGNPGGYAVGTRIEVRYWPHDEQIAVDTVHEPRVPMAWFLGFPAVGFLAGILGLKVATRRVRPKPSSA